MIAQQGSALHVDRVLADPLGVPQGLDRALRRMERGAREHRELLAPLAARPEAAEPVRAAAQELERFLEDGERSPLLRALRRPLRQIAPGTPGWQNLQRSWDGLRSRAEGAVRLQEALDGIRAEVARVRERFADELPRATREVLQRERLEEPDVARIGRAEDVRPLHARLRRAEHELEQLWARVDAASDAQLQRGASWAEDAAPGEVLALLQLRLRERGRLLHERDRARTLRLLAARQLQALGRAGADAHPRRDASHVVAERLGNLLLRDQAGASAAEDLALWSDLLGATSDALHQPERAGWAANLDSPEVPAEREFGSTRFVVPIDATYVLITQGVRSCVRILDRAVDVDREVECRVFLERGDVETLPLARLDVEPLFDGLEDAPAWYGTKVRARLQVIARHGGGWIARLVRRGTLARSPVPAWNPAPRDDDRLRVLGTLSAPASAEALPVGPTDEAPREFCGVRTIPVATPLAECATAWLRLPAGGGWAAEAVDAEHACFRAVARQSAGTVPVWAGRGRLDGRAGDGPLYVPPLGLRAGELPALRTWLFSGNALPALHAVARLWLRLVEAGWGIGAYHADALVFSLGWRPEGQRSGPAAHAVVAEAPFAALLGQAHRRPPPEEALFPLYEGLGCRVLPPATALGEAALPSTEAQAFALFALDVLAREPLPLPGIVAPDRLAQAVPDLTAHFIHPDSAVRLAATLRPGAETSHIVKWIQQLAKGHG